MNPRNRAALGAVVAALAGAAAAEAQQATERPAEARVIAPRENLVAEGIPPIPAVLADEVRRYTEYRSAGLADWHPRRREILIATRFGNTTQVHRVKFPGGARSQLTFFDEPVGGATYEPTTGEYFLFLKDEGGNEFAQIYRHDVGTGAVTLLTDGGRSQNGGIRWAHGGHRIAYGSTRRNGADRDIYVMDPRDPATDRRVLEVSGGGWSVQDWSPDDRRLLVAELRSVNQGDLWLVDVATGATERLTPSPPTDTVAYGPARFAPDGRSVYLTTDQGSEFRRLARLDLATRRLTPLTPDLAWDVEAFELSPDGRTIAFTVNEAGVSRLRLLDTRTGAHRPVRSVPVGLVGGLDWSSDGRELGFGLSTARSAADVYSLDVRSGRLTRWTESETGGLDTSALPEPELVRWTSFDGREITGFYYRPPARFTGKRPVLITIHGGPEGQARPGFLGRTNYFLMELGVAVIYPNVRGSTGFGKTFVKLDNGMRREDAVRDIGALLDWIAARPELDASRVMVTGGSYGGYMTLAVATTYDDRICCSLDVVGISNFVTFLQNTERYRRDLRRVEYGDERDPAMRAFMERIAPVNNAHRITKPLFVVQGGNDPRVPRSEAEQIVAAARRNGTPVWYLLATDEGHGFAKKDNADFQFYATVRFMRQFLLREGT
ncbi:MAG TPA: S9 family peptidase [Gemmatimonadales bacterium]|nr:S9 family peptidase [Gemmatimonadales bacterium]